MIKVFDDILTYTDLVSVFDKCLSLGYTFGHSANSLSKVDTDRMVCYLDNEKIPDGVLGNKVMEVISQNVGVEEKLIFSKSYINFYTFDTPTGIHSDSGNEGSMTALFFPNIEWNPQWGGELLFYDDTLKNVIDAVCFVPNRLVLFDARIPHCAKQPSISSLHPRFSIAYKIMLESVYEKENKREFHKENYV